MMPNLAALHSDPVTRPRSPRPVLVAIPGANGSVSCASSQATNKPGRLLKKGAGNLANSPAGLQISLSIQCVNGQPRNSAPKWAVECKDDVPAVRRAPTPSDTGPPSARCSGSTIRAPRGPSVLRCVNHGSGPMIHHHSLRSLRSSVERQQILVEARPFSNSCSCL